MANVDRQALRELVQLSGKSARKISLDANLGATAIRDILSGKSRDPGLGTLAAIAGELHVPLERLLEGDGAEPAAAAQDGRIAPSFLHVRHRARAGHWYEIETEEPPVQGSFAVAPDPRFSRWPQWLEQVEGDSANKKIPAGHYAHVVDAIEMGYAPRHDDWVIVERRRDQGATRERSIKQVVIRPDGAVELWPRSTNPKWSQPLRLNTGHARIVSVGGVTPESGEEIEVEIVGLVIGAYDPFF